MTGLGGGLRSRSALILGALVLASCGGGDGRAANSSPAVSSSVPTTAAGLVTAPDGGLSISIPDGATGRTAEITAARIPASDLDPALASAGDGFTAYDLQPSGLSFSSPVTITFTIESPDLDGATAPLVFAGIETDEGYAALDGSVDVVDGALLVTAQVDHFSRVFAYLAGERVSIPATVDAAVGEVIDLTVRGVSSTEIEDGDFEEIDWSIYGPLERDDTSPTGTRVTVTCAVESASLEPAYTAVVTARPFDAYRRVGGVSGLEQATTFIELLAGVSEARWSTTLTGSARCMGGAGGGATGSGGYAVPPETREATIGVQASTTGGCDRDGFFGNGESGGMILASPTGWRISTGSPSGHFEPDGTGGLVWIDSVGPAGLHEEQGADETVEVVELRGDVIVAEVTRTEYPDDGPACTQVFRVELAMPAGWVAFLSGLPAPTASPFSIEGLELSSANGTLTVSGKVDGPDRAPVVEVRVLTSGADGETATLVPVTPDGGGSFRVEIPTGTAYCFVQVSIDGHRLEQESFDCE